MLEARGWQVCVSCRIICGSERLNRGALHVKNAMQVVSVPYFEWAVLDNEPAVQQNYIRELLPMPCTNESPNLSHADI